MDPDSGNELILGLNVSLQGSQQSFGTKHEKMYFYRNKIFIL